MYNKRFFILIFILTFLLCGCSVDYDIKINKDLSIDESFTVAETKEKIRQSSSANSYNELVENVRSYSGMDTSKYNIQEYKKSNFLGSKVTRSYKSIEEYVNNINNNNLFTTDTKYTKSGNISTFVSKIIYEENEEFVSIVYSIDANINIKVPFTVIESNADYVDEKNKIYSWNLKNYVDSKKTEDIKLVFNTDEVDKDFSDYLGYIIICIIVICLFVFGIVIYKKSNKTLEL